VTRYVLYTGKGGVGKTTCAAATGLALAADGAETLVVSTDPAHSLGDSLGVRLGGDPTRVVAHLDAVEVSPERGQAAYRRVVDALVAEFRDAGLRIDEETLEDLFEAGLAPGGDEVAALEYLADLEADADYDWIVLDTAPTGHTLRLLGLPDVLSAALGAAGEVRGQVRRLANTARSLLVGPAAFARRDDDEGIEALRDRLDRVAALLRDGERASVRVVLTPEAMALAETERLVERLRGVGVSVDGAVVNRVLVDEADCCDRCRSRRARHAERVREIRERFPDLSLTALPELEGEAGGVDGLRPLAVRLRGTVGGRTDGTDDGDGRGNPADVDGAGGNDS
jgi:arsenite-transporting ATPase